MLISSDQDGEVLIVGLKGRLDAATSKTLEAFLSEKIESGENRLVLDLADLDYISSVGLRVFLTSAKRLKVAQGRIAVCSLQVMVREVFEIAGFTSFIPMFATRDEAHSAVRQAESPQDRP